MKLFYEETSMVKRNIVRLLLIAQLLRAQYAVRFHCEKA